MKGGERGRENGMGKGETDTCKENKYVRMERREERERERKGK